MASWRKRVAPWPVKCYHLAKTMLFSVLLNQLHETIFCLDSSTKKQKCPKKMKIGPKAPASEHLCPGEPFVNIRLGSGGLYLLHGLIEVLLLDLVGTDLFLFLGLPA
jgi:hypothetical protein